MQSKHDIIALLSNKDIAKEVFKNFQEYSDLARFLQINSAVLPLIARTDIGKQFILQTKKYNKQLTTNEWLKVKTLLIGMGSYGISLLTFASIPYIASRYYSDDLALSLSALPLTAAHGMAVGGRIQYEVEFNKQGVISLNAVMISFAVLLFANMYLGITSFENYTVFYTTLSAFIAILGEVSGLLTGATIEHVRCSYQKEHKLHSEWLKSNFFSQELYLEKKTIFLITPLIPVLVPALNLLK